MTILKPEFDLERFFDRLQDAAQRALLLDYDGTLAPFHADRRLAVPHPELQPILHALARAAHTRLVIVSGRAVSELLELLGLSPVPELWGSHGWERLPPGGRLELGEMPATAQFALAKAAAELDWRGWHARCERKPASVALHWRGLSHNHAREIHAAVLPQWTALAQLHELEVHDFDGGIELRVPGRSKATAVTTLQQEMGAEAVVAFLGDDRTDEDGFRALQGRGAAILVRPELRPTAADVWLQPPHELRAFLERWLTVCETP